MRHRAAIAAGSILLATGCMPYMAAPPGTPIFEDDTSEVGVGYGRGFTTSPGRQDFHAWTREALGAQHEVGGTAQVVLGPSIDYAGVLRGLALGAYYRLWLPEEGPTRLAFQVEAGPTFVGLALPLSLDLGPVHLSTQPGARVGLPYFPFNSESATLALLSAELTVDVSRHFRVNATGSRIWGPEPPDLIEGQEWMLSLSLSYSYDRDARAR